MRKALLAGLFGLTLSWVCVSSAWANADVSPEKIRLYAQIYPDLFQNTVQTVSNRPAGSQSRATTLLLDSFNGNTDVDELSAVLRPSDRSPMKPESQLKQLVSSRGLQWEDYQEITHALASNPEQFKDFLNQLDHNKIQKSLLDRASADSTIVRQISSLDHQIILRNLLDNESRK